MPLSPRLYAVINFPDGCDLFEKCLDCPLPACQFEMTRAELERALAALGYKEPPRRDFTAIREVTRSEPTVRPATRRSKRRKVKAAAGKTPRAEKRRLVREYLLQRLASGPVPVTELKRWASSAGVSWELVRLVGVNDLGVQVLHSGPGRNRFIWALR